MKRVIDEDRLKILHQPGQGLDQVEAARQLEQYGKNIIAEATASDWSELLRETGKDPMLWFLVVTSTLFALAGESVEATILFIALIPFLGMDIFLHQRTQASIDGLSSSLATQARVMRDSVIQSISANLLVPGDWVQLESGEHIPADGIFMDTENLQVDESVLTGEAYPVHKKNLPSISTSPQDAHWGFAGTRILTGKAWLKIIYTGGDTLYGDIIRSATQGIYPRTPLQQAVIDLVKWLIVVAILMCVVMAGIRYQQGRGLMDALLSALTLAVAALPEEFPVVLTFFLGVGVYRLAKRKALVRRAVVVENIGRVSCICSDKTGTLTEGRLHLTDHTPAENVEADWLLILAAAASRADSGDPMDDAILQAHTDKAEHSVLARFPFTEDRKRETTLFIKADTDTTIAATKGAPETILDICELSVEQKAYWHVRIQQLAAETHKVIACAWCEYPMPEVQHEPDRGFQFAGILIFSDPVRAGVPEAIRVCQEAGINVIMVTGDHPETATAIARRIGLGTGTPRVIEGEYLMWQLQNGESEFLQHIDVVARAIPAQKHALVRALQKQGQIVAVTGDGVNDVPALQAADIGIAMGGRGTRSAREAAAIVLLDDNFDSIVHAIAEGRQLFRNLQCSFAYLLMIHIPLVITAALIPLLGYPLLYLPVHIVWMEMIIHPTAMLVFQDLPHNQRIEAQVPAQTLRFFTTAQWSIMLVAGLLVSAISYYSYTNSLYTGHNIPHARTLALMILIVASAAITSAFSGLRSRIAKIVTFMTTGFSILLIYIPGLAELLHLQPLYASDWLTIGAAGGLLFVLTLMVIKRPMSHK